MKRRDWNIIFTAMAFVAIIGKSKKPPPGALKDDVLGLARLIDEFCQQYVISASTAVADEGDAMLTDQIIEKHVRELRETGSTRAPNDRQTLIKLHDRLQHRQARRPHRELYADASHDRLADAVLDFLNDEIDGMRTTRLA